MDPESPSIDIFALKLSKLFIVPTMLFNNSSPDSAEREMLKNIAKIREKNFIFSTYRLRGYTTINIFVSNTQLSNLVSHARAD